VVGDGAVGLPAVLRANTMGAKRIIELSRHRVARLIEVKGGFYIEGRQYWPAGFIADTELERRAPDLPLRSSHQPSKACSVLSGRV
jgi:hypothetical protein